MTRWYRGGGTGVSTSDNQHLHSPRLVCRDVSICRLSRRDPTAHVSACPRCRAPGVPRGSESPRLPPLPFPFSSRCGTRWNRNTDRSPCCTGARQNDLTARRRSHSFSPSRHLPSSVRFALLPGAMVNRGTHFGALSLRRAEEMARSVCFSRKASQSELLRKPSPRSFVAFSVLVPLGGRGETVARIGVPAARKCVSLPQVQGAGSPAVHVYAGLPATQQMGQDHTRSAQPDP